jgi:hypothetical protein
MLEISCVAELSVVGWVVSPSISHYVNIFTIMVLSLSKYSPQCLLLKHLEYFFLRLRDEISLFYSVTVIGSVDTPYVHCSLQQAKYLMMA